MCLHSKLKSGKPFFALTVFVLLALAGNNNTIAQQLSLKDIIKVHVTGPDNTGQAATGFLWQNSSQVVTSLHAVLRSQQSGYNIEVFCNGPSTFAFVDKVLIKADLVLLKTDKPIDGCTVFKDSFPECSKPDHLKPNPGTELFTAGWKGVATTATTRNLIKGEALGPETLEGLVSKKETREAIIKLQLPDMSLDIYLVGGDGLGGGYSGGPVIDKQRNLLAVVDGGMDKGATDYNWLVPAKYLNCLSDSQVNKIPKVDLALLDALFSAGVVAPGKQTEVVYTPQPGQQQIGSQYHFVYSKTRWLKDIVATADPRIAESIQEILQVHEAAVGTNAVNELQFDFFKDTDRNLIIAVPTGQGLVDGPLPEYPDIHQLRSNDKDNNGFIQYQEIVTDADGYQTVAVADDDSKYFPEEDGYFDAFIDEKIRDCRNLWNNVCELDDPSIWITNFSEDNKVLTFGYHAEPTPTKTGNYFYYNVTVRNNTAFTAKVQLPGWPDGLVQCGSPGVGCTDNRTALLQLQQLVAANLTTFAHD